MQYLDYICLAVCCVHIVSIVYEFIHNLILGKRINKLCDKCGLPEYDGIEHKCQLTGEEISLLTQFILSVKDKE